MQLDIADLNACMRACAGIDTVIHLAAEVSPDISDFMTTLLPTNVVGTYNIFQAALAQGCRRVVFGSSAQTIEGYPEDVQVSETMPVRPKNLYGVTKVFGEALGSYISDTSDLSIIAVRIANVAHFSRGEQHSARDVAAYISVRDVVQLLNASVQSNVTGFVIVNGYRTIATSAFRSNEAASCSDTIPRTIPLPSLQKKAMTPVMPCFDDVLRSQRPEAGGRSDVDAPMRWKRKPRLSISVCAMPRRGSANLVEQGALGLPH